MEACKQEPTCEEAWDFAGQLQGVTGEHAAAEDSFRKAFKLNPNNRRYAELIRDLSRLRK